MFEHDPPELIDIFIDCSQCHGKGSVKDEWPTRVNRPGEVQFVTCPKCGGAGELSIEVCSRCRLQENARGNQPACDCWERDEMALQDVHELVIGR